MAPRRSKFVGPQQLDEAIAYIANIRKGVSVVLVGGAAMQLYGSPRLTHDVDVASATNLGVKSSGRLSFGGVKTKAPNGVKVDIIVRNDDYAPLYEEAIEAAQSMSGIPLPVVPPEYLAAMKMATGRHGKDDDDLEYLIMSGSLNLGRTRDILRRHLGNYAVTEFDAEVEIAEWKKSSGMGRRRR